ncbi:MAG: DUF4252 domain-containing protein [Xanthomonadales bacterium]|nr:DUF4252 domain-containing protein [Xanthomonadales bacterium]
MLYRFIKPLAIASILLPLTAGAADRNHPGRIDLSRLGAIDAAQELVNIRLDGWLLGFARKAAEESRDPDAQVLSDIDSVQIRVFEIDDRTPDLAGTAADLVDQLRRDAWETFATVRSRDGFVYVLVKGSDQMIDGITLVALDEGHEAVFVNVAGRLHPDDIARIIEDKDLVHADIDLSFSDQE